MDRARTAGLDLVEVAPNANPPVCRILDYGKFKYEQSKKERDARKHQHQAQLREVRFKPKIGVHDIDFKMKVVEKLLKDGDKVKVSVMFRGREITHPEIGRELLMRVAAHLKEKEAAIVERPPSMEGRFMNMYLAPVAPKMAPKPKAPRAERPRRDGSGEEGGETAMSAALKAAGAAGADEAVALTAPVVAAEPAPTEA